MHTQTKISRPQLLLSYFQANPNRDIPHAEAAGWATARWREQTGSRLCSPGGAIRALYRSGLIARVARGVYRYDPDAPKARPKPCFTAKQRKEIFERDDYKCVVCGLGKREGEQVRAALMYPTEMGGEYEVDNAYTLCVKHFCARQKAKGIGIEMMLEHFAETFEKAKDAGNEKMQKFCQDVSAVKPPL